MKNKNKYTFTPIIIIGAARSGTNILRDTLAQLPSVTTWPCEEIKFIWRHGNARYPSDIFPKEFATSAVKKYVRGNFYKLAKKNKCKYVLEKTCSNSLRVNFVNEIFPEAKYIFIVRNGIDVVASMKKRWKTKFEPLFIFKKALYAPITDMPYYTIKYLYNRLYKIFSKENRLAYWGPIFDDMDKLIKKYTLDEICALQWKECVDQAEDKFKHIQKDRIFRLRYEDFVSDPKNEINKIVGFLDIDVGNNYSYSFLSEIFDSSIGKGNQGLDDNTKNKIYPLIESTMLKYNYQISI